MKRALTAAVLACLTLATSAYAQTSVMKEEVIENIAINLANQTIQGGYKLITMEKVKEMIDAGEDFILVDAHPQWEFEKGYIPGARHFGFMSNRVGKWEEDVDMAGSPTQDDYRKVLGPDLNKKIVIYCGFTKCGRSHNAATWAKKLGYTNVYRAPGGITSWMDHGYPYKVVPNDAHTYPHK